MEEKRRTEGSSKDRRGEKEKPKARAGTSRHEGGGARRSDKKESSEDQKKAAELKDKLKNYLKKAKEAKEAKKKVKK